MIARKTILLERLSNGVGYVLSILAAGFFSLGIIGLLLDYSSDTIPAIVVAFAFVLNSVVAFICCVKRSRLIRDAQRFADCMEGRQSCSVRDLACALGRSEDSVRKALRKMLKRDYFHNVSYNASRDLVSIVQTKTKASRCVSCGSALPTTVTTNTKCECCGERIRKFKIKLSILDKFKDFC